MIQLLKDDIPIVFLLDHFKVSSSGYYSWQKRRAINITSRKEKFCDEIKRIFKLSKETYGSPRMTVELESLGLKISENTVAKYMKELGLDARLKKKFRVLTTDSNHDGPIADRLFKYEEDLPKGPSEILAGDITYIKTPSGFMYLSVVMDLFRPYPKTPASLNAITANAKWQRAS